MGHVGADVNSSDVDDSSMELGIGNEEPCSMLGKRASVPHLKVDCRKHVGLYMPTPHQETEDRNQGPRRTSKSTCILVSFCSSLRQSPVSRRSDHRLGPYSSGGCGHRGGYCRKVGMEHGQQSQMLISWCVRREEWCEWIGETRKENRLWCN